MAKPRPFSNPPHPYLSTTLNYLEEVPLARVRVHEDTSRSILAHNDSPDVGFTFSVNPYRGCMHGCAYCYARPGHEYLGFGAGTDFETQIVVKREAARLLREAFLKPSWKGELVAFSGVTDCYQPLEASLRLTQACLEVCAEFRNPVAIITKAPLIERDVDILLRLNEVASVGVAISIPFWDEKVARALEPGVATPRRRVETVRKLAAAGIPTGVSVAPLIPGLEEDVPRILGAAAEAGATSAGHVLLRLPGSVADVFVQRLREALPLRAERVLHRLRETRRGKLYDARFSVRGRGEGEYAEAIHRLFEAAARKAGLHPRGWVDDQRPSTFHRPGAPQLPLL